MGESRWVRWIAPGLFAVWAVGAISAATAGRDRQPHGWVPATCPGPMARLTESSRATASATSSGRARRAVVPARSRDRPRWIAHRAAAVGRRRRRLGRSEHGPAVGVIRGRARSAPVILVGADDGRDVAAASRRRFAARCSWSIGQTTDVIRRATIDPSGTRVLEMRVAADTHAPISVSGAASSTGGGEAQRVVAAARPRRADSAAPSRPNSCGTRPGRASRSSRVARSRAGRDCSILRAASSRPSMIRLLARSSASTVTRSSTTARAADSPARSSRPTRDPGSQHAVVTDGGPAVILQTSAGSRLVDEASVGRDRRLRSTDVANGAASDLGPMPSGQALLPTADRASSATRVPPEAGSSSRPDGRLPAGTSSPRALLRHVPDGLTVPIDEAIR